MSTQVVNPNPVLTDQTDLIKQQMDAYFKEKEDAQRLANGGMPPGPGPQPIKLNVGGQELTFETPQQAADKFAELQRERDEALRQAQYAQTLASQPQPTQPTTQQTLPQVDMEKYLDLLAKDPIKAAEYVDEIRYGYDPVKTNQLALMKLIQIHNWQQSELFKSQTPDYDESQENATVVQDVMRRYNYSWTAENLQAAYQLAKANNLIKTTQQQEQPLPLQYQQQYTPPTYAPSVGRGASNYQEATSDIAAKAEQMDAESLGNLIKRLEAGGVR